MWLEMIAQTDAVFCMFMIPIINVLFYFGKIENCVSEDCLTA